MEENKKLPFKVVGSEVSGGYIDKVHNEFTSSIDLVNYHLDIYSGDTSTIQSPFTEKWVGGSLHRHIPLNSGNDKASDRPEAWHLEFDPTGVTIHPHSYLDSPPARWNRETLAKRPINVANIRNNNFGLGNYSRNYEVVQTSGRRIANNLIVDGYVADENLTTSFITGANNYGLPDLTNSEGKTVIVERFNAPGSKEESSRGSLDREGEEMSPNISLPWRNYKIRKPFYGQLSKPTPQFGGTIHGVNRNTLFRGDQEYKDNGYVVHAIPQTDIQYSWITASTNTSAKELGWYQTFAGTYNKNNAFTDIIFDEKIEMPRNLCKDYQLETKSSGSFPEEPNTTAYYGLKNATSPDGKTIATMSPYMTFDNEDPQEASIHLYTKNDNKWSISQAIPFPRYSIGPLNYEPTINNLCFSGDSAKLFVQVSWTESTNIEHKIHVYEKQNGVWIEDITTTIASDANCSSRNLSVNGAGTVFSISDGDTKVYVYRKTGNNSWTIATILNPVSSGGGKFGYSLGLSYHGDKLIIGAYGNHVSGYTGAGKAYLYTYDSITQVWSIDTNLIAPDYNEQGDPSNPYESRFGWSVAINQDSDPTIDGTVIAVGSPYKAPGGSTYFRAGEVYVWEWKEISGLYQWRTTQIFLEDREEYDLFGIDISLNGRGDLLAISNEKKPQAFLYKKTSDFFLYENSRPRWELAKIVNIQEPNNQISSIRHTWISIDQDAEIIALSAPTLDTNPSSSTELLEGIFHIFERPTYLDNNFITSVFKDNKKVDIDTATFSMDHSVLHCYPSFSEITNSPYTFTTWETIRNSESPVVKQQRKNNILRIENRTSRLGSGNKNQYLYDNYTEPPVTFKYKPLETYVNLYDTNEVQTIEHTYANNLSAFANKEINRQIATLPEDSRQFYDFLYDHYTAINTADNPISGFKGFSYSEVIWPKEENTGLSQTRKREAYYLDRPGFTRDGFDIQLGTQRAFWRDSQEDRKRSDNLDGGYYSSLNYLSTEETGSITSLLTDDTILNIVNNNTYDYTSSFNREIEIRNFNSIVMLEVSASEQTQYSSSTSYYTAEITNSLGQEQEIASYYRKTAGQRVLGEHNEKFTDFFGYNGYSGSLTSSYSDLGTFYRNSYYKNLFITREVGVDSHTEGNILSVNPKLRYVSFVGGAELNNDTSFQNTWFTNQVLNNTVFDQTIQDSDVAYSTMDNGLQRVVEQSSGKTGFFDSYEKFLQEIYPLTKEMSQIPEFKISQHMEDYVNTPGGFGKDYSIFQLDGIDENNYKSGNSRNERNNTFIKNYSTSDLLKKYKKVLDDNRDTSVLDKVSVKVTGIKKLLPENGFYPQDRITQIANLYGEFVDNNLAGGLYKSKYSLVGQERIFPDLKTYIYNYATLIDSPSLTDDARQKGVINAITSVESGDYVYIAYAMAKAAYISSPTHEGTIAINKIQKDNLFSGPTGWTIPPTWIHSDATAFDLGEGTMRFVSGSSDVFLFYKGTESSGQKIILYSKLSDGFSTRNGIVTSVSSGFGHAFDCIYDEEDGQFVLAISDPTASTNSGEIQIWTSTNGTSWSLETTIAGVSLGQKLGTSLSLYKSATTGYNLYAGAPASNNFSSDGEIKLFRSSDASTWTNTKDLFTGGSGTNNTFPGYGGLKAVEDTSGRIYLFWNEVYYPNPIGIAPYIPNGAFLGAFTDDDWTSHTKEVLFEGDRESFPVNRDAGSSGVDDYLFTNVIDATIRDGKVHYFVGANQHDRRLENSVVVKNAGMFAYGIFQNETFQKQESMYISKGEGTGAMHGGCGTIINVSSSEEVCFMYSPQPTALTLTSKYKAIEFSIDVESENAQKSKVHAALEPTFAPGIMYNTIKSGIAVDWPCSTGSVSFVQTGDNVTFDRYFPKPIQMFGLEATISGHAYNLNARGNLKSEINYRIPFETILDPKEIFETKEENITTNTQAYIPAGIPAQSGEIVNLLDKCYVYGGYETYFDPSDIESILDLPPQKLSVPFIYRKTQYKDNGLFTMAVNNYFAETVNFFLEEGKLTTFESNPDNEWSEFQSGKVYYMDVSLQKTSDLTMMESYLSDKHPTGSSGEKMNGRYFGYPVNKTVKDIWTEEFTSDEAKLIHNDPAYAPYTPPYFEGKAIARISFEPEVTGKYTVTEVLERINIESVFVEATNGWVSGSDAHLNSMPVEASVDLRGIAKVVRSEVRQRLQQTDSTVLTELPDNKKWVISTRMETPVLDFSDQAVVAYQNNYIRKSGYGRGMWSGYGKLPTSGSGISVELSYPFGRDFVDPYSRANAKQSLLQHIGFKAESKKVGQIRRNGKQIKEAVVLIPYLENPNGANRRVYTTKQKFFEDLYFININKTEYNKQKRRIESGEDATDRKESTSISRMIETMKDYVIPPYLDFLNDSTIKPFVMYLAEFEHQFTQQDLVDMWQGLMPDISYNAELEEVEISHPSAQDEFFHGKNLPDNLRWLVFRVKQRAVYDFGKITSSTKDDQRFAQNTIVGREGIPYSYNWPYDFFSLVEFAKVEIDLKYKPRETAPEMIALQTVNNFDNE